MIFASPEAVLTRHCELLKNVHFNQGLKVIAIDESHCIKKWYDFFNIYLVVLTTSHRSVYMAYHDH